MEGYITNIEKRTVENDFFREVLFTTPLCQLVVMSLKPGEDIGLETHYYTDQFIRIEQGNGVATLNGQEIEVQDGSAVVIPAGASHNLLNTSPTETLKIYTLYTPPEHPDKIIHETKAEAEAYEEEHLNA